MILVFGRTGQVATELRLFANVHTLGREQANLSDPLACAEVIRRHRPRAVINAAAYTDVDKAEMEENLATVINGDAPAAMAAACADLGIPLVHISTDYVFDGIGLTPWSVSDCPNPQNAYGRSKLKGEQEIMASGCTYVILRTSWIFSAYGNNFAKTMWRLSKKQETISVVSDQVGGPTFAREVAQTCISIVEQIIRSPDKSGVYHYSGAPNVSWLTLANNIFQQLGSKTTASAVSTRQYPALANRPLNSRLDCSKTKTVFGVSRPSWRDGLIDVMKDLELGHDRT